jgi:D-alanyl-D-alanine carboxypeptidase
VRGDRRLRLRRPPRAPFVAALLSLLALSAPPLALAPLHATEPARRLPPLVDELPVRLVPERRAPQAAVPVDGGIVVSAPGGARAGGDEVRWRAALGAARTTASAFGITFAAVRDGEVVWAGSDGRTRDGGTSLAPDSTLVVGSVMKTFVAATVLQLAAEGALSLDDPARLHLGPYGRFAGEVTVDQLLDHTSGLADLFNDTTRRGLETEPTRAWTPAEVLGTVQAPWYQPGEGWAYSNTNYLLLALIVERLADAPLADVLRSRFTGPLGLASTSVLTGAPGEALPAAWSTIFAGSGAMISSAADLARWGDALYGGSLLTAADLAAMLAVNDDDYGLGVQRIEVGEISGYGHTGLLNTDTTLLLHLPTHDVTIALLVNRSHVDLAAMLAAAPPDGGPSLLELATGD